MRGYLDPPEEPELPICCGDYMEYSDADDTCACPGCGKLVEPTPDPEISHYKCPHGIYGECSKCDHEEAMWEAREEERIFNHEYNNENR